MWHPGDPCKEFSLHKKYIREVILGTSHGQSTCILPLWSEIVNFSKMTFCSSVPKWLYAHISKVTMCSHFQSDYLLTFPKWLSAQVFQSDYLLLFPKWLSAQDFHEDFLLNIKLRTLKVSQHIHIYIYIYDTCSLGPTKGIKTLRMSFRVVIFPLVRPPNGPKWPPTGYTHHTRVILWVTEQDLAP